MIIKYDLNKFFKENKLVKTKFAKRIGMSKQLFNYYLNKGDISLSMLVAIAEELNITPQKLTKILNNDYIKIKI
jgi:transcriptional regulator with XRE-family HTH domain